MAVPIKSAAFLIAIMASSAAMAADEEPRITDHIREADHTSIEGPAEFFTGKATVKANFQRDAPSRITGGIVEFEPGTRTAWHKHPLGQTLIVIDGVGWTQIEGGPKTQFQKGDILWCPPEHRHWHGATPNNSMTHIAIQESLDGTNVVWMEQVTDEEYLGPPAEE